MKPISLCFALFAMLLASCEAIPAGAKTCGANEQQGLIGKSGEDALAVVKGEASENSFFVGQNEDINDLPEGAMIYELDIDEVRDPSHAVEGKITRVYCR